MGLYAFLGGFAALALIGGFVVFRVRRKLRRFSIATFGTTDIIGSLKAGEAEAENTPRSLNGMDAILLPQILKDFPDFDVQHAKQLAEKALRKYMKNREGVSIHNIVIARYMPASIQKTVVFQASASYQEGGHTVQKRYDLTYAYRANGSSAQVAANCPNCGSPLQYSQRVCPYCGSQVTQVLGLAWSFIQIMDS